VIHQLFAIPGGKTSCENHQLDAKITASTETRQNMP